MRVNTSELRRRQQGFTLATFLAETPVNLAEHGDLLRLRDAVLQHLPDVLAAEASRRLASANEAQFFELRRKLELSGGKTAKAEVVQGLQAAIEGYNLPIYRATFERLTDLHHRREVLQQRQRLLAKLEQVAPAWAAAIRDRSGRHGERDLPGKPEDAWLWQQLHNELERRAKISLEELQQQIAQLSNQLQRTTALLVEQQAWAAQVRRTTLEQRQALTGWKQTMQRIGKGTGKRAPRLRAEARKLMPICQSAVPVWIMPLSRVVENFDPRRNRFDVIIIDEASQADLMALTAVYLGRQVVVVGDHEQVSPLAVGQRVDDAQRLIDEHLQGIPNAILYDGQYSIYNLAQSSFDPVCLREHFRCVAPIIEFSNRLAYDGRIKPLRDASQVRRRPYTVAYRVQGASSNDRVNEQEALEAASLLVATTEQPEYDGASFGVVSLVGDEQAQRIEALLHRHLAEAEYQRRRIQCGNAAQFQGDERDVMFLSMVSASTGEGPLRIVDSENKTYRQRFNVAASRARDQMWVVHSLDPEVDLKPGDLRRRLIEHTTDPEAIKRSEEQQQQQTESELERLVLRWLVQAGYRVKTQWPVGAYRLDLVVEGNNKRLAIECDGDRYHTQENLAEDMGRQAILERLGWRFARIRGSEFFRNPDKTMDAVFARLRNMDIPPEGTQTAESNADAVAEELKQRIIRRAAELRREWAEQGEEALSYSGMLSASSRRRWSQPEPAQKPAPAAQTQPASTPPAAPVQSAKPTTITPIGAAPKELPASNNVPGGSVDRANLPRAQSPAQAGAQSKSQRFFRGDIVKHPAFGIGTVLSSSFVGGTEFVRIDFKGQVRIKSVDAETGRLEKVQTGTQLTQPTASDAAAAQTDTKGPKQTFVLGELVRHPTYGTGKVVKGSAAFSSVFDDDFVQVDFGGQVGKKILDLVRESLEKITPALPASLATPASTQAAKPATGATPQLVQKFHSGDQVRHRTFGLGRVVRSAIISGVEVVRVDFGGKSIDVSLPYLEKVQEASHPSHTTPTSTQQSAPSNAQAQTSKQVFLAGDYAKHPVYGIGRVVSNGNKVVEIDFGGQAGKKTFDVELAPLEKVQRGMQPTPAVSQSRPVQPPFDLLAFLRSKGIEIIDKRSIGGALWIVGGSELWPLVKELGQKRIQFNFVLKGTKSTGYRPAWYTQWPAHTGGPVPEDK
jgi:very-short-patch-repair endonuclease